MALDFRSIRRRLRGFASGAAIVAATLVTATMPSLAQGPQAAQPHRAAAKAAAGEKFTGLYTATCGADAAAATPAPARARPAGGGPPDRAEWYAPPHQVFDNLYWVGTKEHSAWALKTSEGIILLDTLYSYAVEAEIVDGLKTLGLDPASIKYVIISHAHGDHDQGAALLQSRFGTKVVMGAPDWATTVARTTYAGGVAKRDIEAVDGQKITLGDTSVTLVTTPGHTLGTLSLLFPVKDHGRTLTVAYSGGTTFNFQHTAERFDTYIASQQKFAKAAAAAGATVVLSNHSVFDHAVEYAPKAMEKRADGKPHVFEVGKQGVANYLKVLEECAVATKTAEFGK
ncbi:MAG TPA: MBL fold metallo-hydrolase [Hyphomonadaceae bacterium]|nr:MBL fold metallo-hydrolase [Hyphomonadaceae bacterium]